MIRLSELTKTRVSLAVAECPHVVARAAHRRRIVQLFVSHGVGRRHDRAFGGGGVAARLYLEKGGFLWVDDFWGDAAWAQWTREFAKAMPPDEYRSKTCRSAIRFSGRCSR